MTFVQFQPRFSLVGNPVSLENLLHAREQRSVKQQQLLVQYRQALLCVTLTAMGAVKKNPLLDYVFEKACLNLTALFTQFDVFPTYQEIHSPESGHEAYFVLNIDPILLKRACIELEDSQLLARLWDLDVFSPNGELISRTDLNQSPRSCLLCENQAKECARTRKHELNAIFAEMQWRALADFIGEQAYFALLDEAYLTPKPGLVDRANNGAHRDMNIATFEKSAVALRPFFVDFVYQGIRLAHLPETDILVKIRPIGVQAEQAMLAATQGINTHKGAIFSFGLICTAIGRYIAQNPNKVLNSQSIVEICTLAGRFVPNICLELTQQSAMTAGAKIYQDHGLLGARGQAQAGFPLLVKNAAFFDRTLDDNLARLLFLLQLMVENDDTNLVHRGGLEGLKFVKTQANRILQNFVHHQNEYHLIEELVQFDDACIERNLSAGGSADLTALGIFLQRLRQKQNETISCTKKHTDHDYFSD